MIKFINKIFLAIVLLISPITYSQTVLLNENPTNAFVGPAANCANNTGGDPTSDTFSYSVDTSCYDELDISITIIPDNPNNTRNPGFEEGDRVEITLTDDNGSNTTTINGNTYNGGNSNTFTTTRTNPGSNLNIDVFIIITGNNNINGGGGCWERLRITNVNITGTGSDSTPPITPTIADETFQCSGTPTTPTTTDSCDPAAISGTTTTTFPITALGTTVVTWTFTDASGNDTTANQNVIIEDTTDPVTPTIADETFQCSGTPTTPTTTDSCDTATISGTTTTTFPITTLGTTVVTWTFTDASGNDTTANQNVIIEDTTDPVTPTIADETFQCSGTPTTPTTTDSCDTATISGTTTTTFPITTLGTTVVTWTFTDASGNDTTANQNVIVQDTVDPVTPTIADETFQCSGTPTIPITTDSCDPATINGTTTTTFPITALGTTVVTWTFTDASGNDTTANQNVIIEDTIDPILDFMPADVTVSCENIPVPPIINATDNCACPAFNFNNENITSYAGTNQDFGTSTIEDNGSTIVLNDNAWKKLDLNYTITANTVIEFDFKSNTIGEIHGLGFTTNNALNSSTLFKVYGTQNYGISAFNNYSGSGNFQHYVIPVGQYFTGFYNFLTFAMDHDASPRNGDSFFSNIKIYEDLDANSQCDIPEPTVVYSEVSNNVSNGTGTIVRQWIATDTNNNTSTHTQTITVQDTTDPVTPTIADETFECSGTPTTPTTTDSCDSAAISGTTTTTFPITALGTTVVTWTFTDANGNDTTANQNVIVNDTADLSLTNTPNTTTVNVGGEILYTLVVTNSGPCDVTGISVRDDLPTGLTYNESNSTIPLGTTYSFGIWDLTSLTLNDGDSITLIIAATVGPDCGNITNFAEIITSSKTDPDSSPNSGN